MDLSIIVVNYNTKKETAACVISCLKEGSKLSKEIIVVDNNSSDGSREYLKSIFRGRKEVIFLENNFNQGFSKAVNRGLRLSKGLYKYLLNSDTRVEKGIFQKLINFSRANKDVGVIGTKLTLPDGSIQKSCFNFPTLTNAIREFWLGEKGVFTPFYKEKVSEVDAVVGASFFITPHAFQKVGLFDERYFMYFEDIDYCKMVKSKGLKVVYYPEVKVFHYHGLSGKNMMEEKDQWKRLIPSSKIYHGVLKHYLINFIIWSGKKLMHNSL